MTGTPGQKCWASGNQCRWTLRSDRGWTTEKQIRTRSALLHRHNSYHQTALHQWLVHAIILTTTRMWANAQRDGRPAECRWRPLFNVAKFGWRPLLQCRAVTLLRCETRSKFAGEPQTRQQIPAVSRPKFTILSGHVEEVLLFNKFFPTVDTCLSSEDIARHSCAMAIFLWPVFPASHVQHISDLHSKFALGHNMCGSMVDVQSAAAEIRWGKKIEERKKIETTGQKYNGLPYYIRRP